MQKTLVAVGREKKKCKNGSDILRTMSPGSGEQFSDNPFLWLWLKTQNLDQCFQLGANGLSLVKGSVDTLLSLLCLEETGVLYKRHVCLLTHFKAPLRLVWKEEAFYRDLILTFPLFLDSSQLFNELIS